MTSPDDDPDDLDSRTRDQLAELAGPEWTVASVLDDWLMRLHGRASSNHGAGLFLDLLAAEGYRVTPIPASNIGDLLPPPTE